MHFLTRLYEMQLSASMFENIDKSSNAMKSHLFVAESKRFFSKQSWTTVYSSKYLKRTSNDKA